MKTTARTIASALVHMASSLPEKDAVHAVDAALLLAKRSGISRYQFLRALKLEIQLSGNVISAMLETPTGEAGAIVKTLSTNLESMLKKNVQLTQKSANILGGAILTVGDDRLDHSIRSAIQRAHHYLRAPTLVSSTSV